MFLVKFVITAVLWLYKLLQCCRLDANAAGYKLEMRLSRAFRWATLGYVAWVGAVFWATHMNANES